MMKKLTLVAGSMAALAAMALPSAASAGGWHIDPPGTSFTFNGGHQVLTGASRNLTCTSITGHGAYDAGNQTTGKITLRFDGCRETAFGNACTSAGHPSGTLTLTPNLVFHNVYTSAGKTTPGVLITSNAGHFASFSCGFGLFNVAVTGNGVMGTVTSPGCGGTSTTATVGFSGTGTTQNHRQITGAGTIFSLQSSVNGGAPNAEARDGSATLTFPQVSTVTCV